MKKENETREQLINELQELRTKAAVLEKSNAERKRIEKELRESEEMYRKLVETSPEAVTVTDLRGRITHVSQKTLTLHGADGADEMLGRSAFDFIAPEDYQRAARNLKKTMWEEAVTKAEYTMLKKDGTRFTGELNATLIRDAEGNPKAFIATVRDITERKRAERALKESEEKFRLFFENEPDYCYMVSPEGNILDVNNNALEILGCKKEEIVGRPLLSTVYAPASRTKARTLFNQWKKKGKIKDEELNIITKHGEERTVLLSVDTIKDTDGKVMSSISVQRDITEWKKAEEQIKASMEEKEVLLREIHHRVRNNLQIISSLLNLQSNFIEDETVRAIFRESQNRIQSISLVHNEVHSSSNLEKIDLHGYLTSLAHHIIESYRVNREKIVLNIMIDDIFVSVDAALSCGLIVNELLSNSLKYAFPLGEGEITIEAHETDGKIRLTVGDNGKGIPENVDFESAEFLGLHLATLLAEDQLRGTITLDRSKGTVFHITFNR